MFSQSRGSHTCGATAPQAARVGPQQGSRREGLVLGWEEVVISCGEGSVLLHTHTHTYIYILTYTHTHTHTHTHIYMYIHIHIYIYIHIYTFIHLRSVIKLFAYHVVPRNQKPDTPATGCWSPPSGRSQQCGGGPV